MFVPGVNGSVIPSAPSGSRLKGAYKNSKNSKKRKMPNGGSTGFGMALEAATYVPGPVGTYASGASALANLYQGDYVGAGLDALNMATFGTAKGLMGVARAANAIRPYSNLAVNAAQASRTVNRVAKKVAPVTRAAGTVNEFTSSPYNATMRTPQRDNTQVQFRPNPNMRRMANGGTLPPIYTSNPRDPRIRSYKDSLNLYNEQNRLNILNDKTNYPQEPAIPRTNKNNLIYTGDPNKGGYVNPKIFSSNIPTFGKDIHGNLRQQYKKPTQPYIYKKPQASPIYTSDLNDSRLRAYNDSLNSYNLAPLYNKQILTNLQKATTVKGGFQANLKTNEEFVKRGLNYQLGFNRKEFPRKTVSDGYVGAIKYEYKKPVQPYIYRKPEVTPEVVETSVASAPAVSPEQPVKKIGYNKPIIQQFNYMSNENKAKALQKYGSVSDIPFQGVDINQLKNGGKTSDDKQMVNGVASILRRVEDKQNRLKLANQLAKQFNREKVKYDLPSFLAKSKVKK
jgi:hypothetical protein